MTHAKSKKRRARIAKSAQKGMSMEGLVRSYELTSGYIAKTCRDHGVDPPQINGSHAAAYQRRAKIAADGRLGLTCDALAKKFNQSPDQIHRACREHGVQLRLPRRQVQQYATGALHPFRVLVRLKEGASDTAIGKEYHVTRERIRQIKELAVELGLLEK